MTHTWCASTTASSVRLESYKRFIHSPRPPIATRMALPPYPSWPIGGLPVDRSTHDGRYIWPAACTTNGIGAGRPALTPTMQSAAALQAAAASSPTLAAGMSAYPMRISPYESFLYGSQMSGFSPTGKLARHARPASASAADNEALIALCPVCSADPASPTHAFHSAHCLQVWARSALNIHVRTLVSLFTCNGRCNNNALPNCARGQIAIDCNKRPAARCVSTVVQRRANVCPAFVHEQRDRNRHRHTH